MSGWGIADTASEIEKIKAESADYLRGLNSCCLIDWNTYDKAFDFYMGLIDASYEQGKKDAERRWTPCTPDTMPEDSNFYIVTRKDFSVGSRWYSVFYGWERQEEEQPIAWMPLPEPYRGE